MIEAIRAAARKTSSEAYFVGGCVRDAVLGIAVKDFDVMVAGSPDALAEEIEKYSGMRAVRHPRFGTFVFPGLDVAASRREVYERPGALPSVRLGVSAQDDLARRDFTVNAMAVAVLSVEYDIASSSGKIIDPFGGLKDIERGLIRTLSAKSFSDDPTRILRAARFAARFGFSVDGETLAQLLDSLSRGAASTVTPARIGKELELLSREPEPLKAFALLDSWGAAKNFFPELTPLSPPPRGFLVKYNIPRSRQKNVFDFVALLTAKRSVS